MAFDFKYYQKLIKEARKNSNVSLEDISKKLKVPKHVLLEFENDETYFDKNYPYSLYLLRELANFLNIKISEVKKEENPEETSHQKKDSIIPKIKEKIVSLFKLSFLFTSLFVFFLLIYSFNKKEDTTQIYNIKEEKINKKDLTYNIQKNINKTYILKIIARKDLWLTANIDGIEKVYKIKKNNRINLSFKKKIYFETIGNADGAILEFKNKKVNLGKNEIVHNIFIDKDGIFKDGYNILEENS